MCMAKSQNQWMDMVQFRGLINVCSQMALNTSKFQIPTQSFMINMRAPPIKGSTVGRSLKKVSKVCLNFGCKLSSITKLFQNSLSRFWFLNHWQSLCRTQKHPNLICLKAQLKFCKSKNHKQQSQFTTQPSMA